MLSQFTTPTKGANFLSIELNAQPLMAIHTELMGSRTEPLSFPGTVTYFFPIGMVMV